MAQVMTPYNTAEVAKMLGVIPNTVGRWALAGKIPGAFRTIGGHWRFDRQAVDTLVKELTDIGTSIH